MFEWYNVLVVTNLFFLIVRCITICIFSVRNVEKIVAWVLAPRWEKRENIREQSEPREELETKLVRGKGRGNLSHIPQPPHFHFFSRRLRAIFSYLPQSGEPGQRLKKKCKQEIVTCVKNPCNLLCNTR